ncbi:MAG: hypothetical protein N3G79_00760 [Sulfolobales archaeon]|nr:hypothetical protein [Sulfolobales archaeon]
MGKYRKYRKRRKLLKRKFRNTVIALSMALSIPYALLAMYGFIPIPGSVLDISIDASRTINATLFRVTYLATTNESSLAKLQINDVIADFNIPAGGRGAVRLGLSKLVEVKNQEVVQPKITVYTSDSSATYPVPPINMSMIGRSEDFILSHYPLELYFVFVTQLCNVTVLTKSDGAVVDEASLLYRHSEEGSSYMPLVCRGSTCEGFLENRCVLSYDIESSLSYLNFLRVRYSGGRAVLRFADNLWILALLYAASVSGLLLAYRKSSVSMVKKVKSKAST